jgi:hypothetical protein
VLEFQVVAVVAQQLVEPQPMLQVVQVVKGLLVAAEVVLSYPMQSHWELQQAVQVALAIYLQVEQVVHQRLLTQAVQAVAVAVS